LAPREAVVVIAVRAHKEVFLEFPPEKSFLAIGALDKRTVKFR
jgi:hypothetical protein